MENRDKVIQMINSNSINESFVYDFYKDVIKVPQEIFSELFRFANNRRMNGMILYRYFIDKGGAKIGFNEFANLMRHLTLNKDFRIKTVFEELSKAYNINILKSKDGAIIKVY